MPVTPRGRGHTDVGRVRKHNEDAFLVDDLVGLYVVADGMGGHASGEVAASESIDAIRGMVKRRTDILQQLRAASNDDSVQAARRLVESAVQAATYLVFGMAEQDPSRQGMGTTISTLLVCGDHAVIAQVGDSRVYLLRDGRPIQITEDHTLINLQLKSGAITVEEAKVAKYTNVITRAVGVKDYVEVDTFDLQVFRGDRLLLCSDGVHGYLDKEEDLRRLASAQPADVCGQAFVQHALARGGKDNATVIVVDLH